MELIMYYYNIFVSKIVLKCSNLENKAILNPICNLLIVWDFYLIFILLSYVFIQFLCHK